MRGGGGQRSSPMMRLFDTDGDGELSQSEIANVPSALRKMDSDGDGKLTSTELRPAGPQGGQRGGGASRGRAGSGQQNGGMQRQGGQQQGGQGHAGQQQGGQGMGRQGAGGGGQGVPPGSNAAGQQRGGGQGGGGPRDRVRPRDVEFNEAFSVGTQLSPDLKLYNVDRELVPATTILKSKYTVIVSGCLTCPAFRSSYPEIEAVHRDFADRGVDFYFLYQSLAHPENWGFVQPTSIEERFAQVAHAKELLKTEIPWLTDPIDNQMKTYFRKTPNSQFVFDQSGKVIDRSSWGRGSSLRESLEKLVGKPETLTTVQDMNLPRFEHQLEPESEMLVERVRVDGVAVPLQVKAGGDSTSVDSLLSSDFGQSNRYVKLRAEADQQLMETGSGKLYLGFRQDPVLGAAWNNLATPPEYKIVAEGATFSPETAQSARLEVESDTEPREFLVDVKDWNADEPIVVKIQYFGCNKEKGWCKSVSQEFTVVREKDELAGMVNGRTHFPGGGGGQRGGGQGRGGQRGGGGQRGQGAGPGR